jgi:hypothetical protein
VANRKASGVVRRALRHPAFFTLILLVFVLAILIASAHLGRVARLVPLVVAVPTFVILTTQLILDLSPRRGPDGRTSQRDPRPASPAVGQLGWALLLPVAIYLLGFLVAVPLHCLIQLRCFSKERWTLSLIIPVGLCGLFVLIARLVPAVPLWHGWIWMRLGIV